MDKKKNIYAVNIIIQILVFILTIWALYEYGMSRRTMILGFSAFAAEFISLCLTVGLLKSNKYTNTLEVLIWLFAFIAVLCLICIPALANL